MSPKTHWSANAPRASYLLRNTTLVLALISLILAVVLGGLHHAGIGAQNTLTGSDPFFHLIFAYEPLGLALTSGGFLFLYALLRRPQLFAVLSSRQSRIGPLTATQVIALSALIVVLVSLGRHFVYLDYDTCADESLSHFQSEVFLSGHVLAPIPPKWQPFSNAAAVPLLTVHPEQQNWCSEFLPVHSLLRMPATWLNFDGYMSAIYLGLNLVAFYYLLRKIWPHHPSRAAIGLALFAAFPQVLVTSMTSYAMATHTLLATLWLLLFLSESGPLFLLTPWLGVLCMGIHQPHIHVIFAAPFVLLLLLQRRFFEIFYFSIVYLGGALFWIGYLHLIRPSSTADGLFNKFGFHLGTQLLIQFGNLALALAWLPLALVLLIVAACLTLWRRNDSFVTCCFLAVAILTGLYFVWPTQGHGWGERFLYPAIPFIIIVALRALAVTRLALGRRAAVNLIAFSAIFAMAVAVPYRFWEVHRFQSTYRAVYDTLARTDADVVLLDVSRIWFGRDFILNTPSLDNRPVMLSLASLTPEQIGQLKQTGLKLKVLGMDDLRTTGHPEDYIREQD